MTPVKKTTTKKVAEEVKVEAKAVEAPKAEAAKAPAKKAPAKKTAAKKAPAKKTAAPVAPVAPVASVSVEFAGKQISTQEVVDKAIAAYKASHADAEVKTVEVYVQPENNVAYYVVNGEGSDDYKIEL